MCVELGGGTLVTCFGKASSLFAYQCLNNIIMYDLHTFSIKIHWLAVKASSPFYILVAGNVKQNKYAHFDPNIPCGFKIFDRFH